MPKKSEFYEDLLKHLSDPKVIPGREERKLAVTLFLGEELEEPNHYAGWINTGEEGHDSPWVWRVLMRIAKFITLLRSGYDPSLAVAKEVLVHGRDGCNRSRCWCKD